MNVLYNLAKGAKSVSIKNLTPREEEVKVNGRTLDDRVPCGDFSNHNNAEEMCMQCYIVKMGI